MPNSPPSEPVRDPVLEAKIRKAKWALAFEQLWRRLWLLLAIVGLFLVLSFAGVWPLLGEIAHKAVMALFALAALAWVVYAARIDWPTRDTAIRRIERVSGIPHRPATSYEDTLTASAADPTTQAIWRSHRRRMADLISRLKPGRPEPRTDRRDPFALRAAMVLAVLTAAGLAGPSAFERIKEAFRFGSISALADARLDAWITPPGYTGRAPIMLADGGSPIAKLIEAKAGEAAKPIDVPAKSIVIVRSSGMGQTALALEFTPTGSDKAERFEPSKDKVLAGDVSEVRTELSRSGTLRALSGGTALAEWPVKIIPDNIPGIALTKNPERTARGAMKLTYFVQDDYGVATAEVKFDRVKKKDVAGQPAKKRLTGPRPPLARPPVFALRLPAANAKEGEAFTYQDIASHPWAGQKVMMTLVAKDTGGNTGQSQPVEMTLPEREFKKPLARAVIEQRRKLFEDSRYRDDVMIALDALTLEGDDYIEDPRVYLGLRTAYYRLERDRSRAGMQSVIEQLWQTALRIEDGNLSEAERALRDAQDRLAKALEEGASEEEIQKLMNELKQAFNEFAKEMQKQADQQDGDQQDGSDKQQEQLAQEDMERMMREMEEMAKSGSREKAQEMLNEMRDMMERMQAGKQDRQQMQKAQDAQKMMRKMGEAAGEQQDIMDDTFEQRRQGQQQKGGQMKQSGQGQKGQRGDGMQADRMPGADGQGDGEGEMQMGERGKDGQGQRGKSGSKGSLAERQKQLREKLDAMKREMKEKGLGTGEKLDDAGRSMEQAEQGLNKGDYEGANSDQADALEALREGAQEMAQQMQQNSPQRYGQNGDSPRDPFGRPQKSQGPDQGTSVKVPQQIDMQRAREILEELRKRLGDAQRPAVEMDYLERLLRRF